MRLGTLAFSSTTAPAKINLTLEILGRREDGYHALRSVMATVALTDDLTFAPSERFGFACEPPHLAPDNLVVRAFAQVGLGDVPLAVTLHKAIPVGAGLGGGSSDAASVLRAAMGGAFGDAGTRDWIADARALGSDVPFFLAGAPALVEGTGERVTALGSPPPWWVVLAVPDVHVATGPAYGMLAEERAASPMPSRPRAASATIRCGEALQRRDFAAVQSAMCNDFEATIARAYPPVRALLDALRAAGAPRPMLSGSGGACFALTEREAGARAIADALRAPAGTAVHVVPFAESPAWR